MAVSVSSNANGADLQVGGNVVAGLSARGLSNGDQLLVGRNRLLNGSFSVDQRNNGATHTFTAGAALAYGVDRWYGFCTGANVTGQRLILPSGFRYRLTGAASVTGVGIGQRIEAGNSFDMAGGNVTVQVRASSTSLTTLNWALYYASTTDSFGTLAAPTRTLIGSGSWTISATENVYSAKVALPSGATTGLELVITGGALLAGQTLTIGEAQLEQGSVASGFEHLTAAIELAACQRYYETGSVYADIYGAGGAICVQPVSFAVTKRTAPTITQVAVGQGGFASTTVVAAGVTATGFAGGRNWASTGASYFQNNWTANAEL